jgi:hypothetical protein
LLKVKQDPLNRDSAPAPRLPPSPSKREGYHPYVAAALRRELNKLSQAEEGIRNTSLNEIAFSLGQFVQAGLIDRSEVEALLYSAALSIGLGELETRRTIQSGIEAGIRHPRRFWPDLS